MNDKHFFADADLPFHVWVRESSARGFRWVLRHASEVHRAGSASRAGSANDVASGRRPSAPL